MRKNQGIRYPDLNNNMENRTRHVPYIANVSEVTLNNNSSANDASPPIIKISVTSRSLLVIGVLIFAINMFFAWRVVFESNEYIRQGLVGNGGNKQVMNFVLENLNQANANEIILKTRAIETEVHLKAIANRQTMAVVAMAAGFSLLAIGFALFVMGIESAFQLSSSAGEIGGVVLKASSPGLLCFILATIIFVVSSQTKHEMSFSSLSVYPDSNNSPKPQLNSFDNKNESVDISHDIKKFSNKVGDLKNAVQTANEMSILYSMNKPLPSTNKIPTEKERDAAIKVISQGIFKETSAIEESLSTKSELWKKDYELKPIYEEALDDFIKYSNALNILVLKMSKPKTQAAFVVDGIAEIHLAQTGVTKSSGYLGMYGISNIRLICNPQQDRHFAYTLVHKDMAYETRVFPEMYRFIGAKMNYSIKASEPKYEFNAAEWSGFGAVQQLIFLYPNESSEFAQELQRIYENISLNEVIILNGDFLRRSLFKQENSQSNDLFGKWSQDLKNWPYTPNPDDLIVRELSFVFTQRLNDYTNFINSQLVLKVTKKTIPSFFQSNESVIKQHAEKWHGDFSGLNVNEKLIVMPLSSLITEINSYYNKVINDGNEALHFPSFFEWDAQNTRMKILNECINSLMGNSRLRSFYYQIEKWDLLGDLFRDRGGFRWKIQTDTEYKNIILEPSDNIDFDIKSKTIRFAKLKNIDLSSIKNITVNW